MIGSEEEATIALSILKHKDFSQVPAGWNVLAGTQRYVFLSPSGIVYKIDKAHKIGGGNRKEYANYLKWKDYDYYNWVIVPMWQYNIDGKLINSAPFIDGDELPVYDELNDKYDWDLVHEMEDAFEAFELIDASEHNCRELDGIIYIIDCER